MGGIICREGRKRIENQCEEGQRKRGIWCGQDHIFLCTCLCVSMYICLLCLQQPLIPNCPSVLAIASRSNSVESI